MSFSLLLPKNLIFNILSEADGSVILDEADVEGAELVPDGIDVYVPELANELERDDGLDCSLLLLLL